MSHTFNRKKFSSKFDIIDNFRTNYNIGVLEVSLAWVRYWCVGSGHYYQLHNISSKKAEYKVQILRQKAFFFRRRFSWPGLCERGCVLYPKKTLWIGATFTTDSKRASLVRYGGAGRLDIRRPPPAFAKPCRQHTQGFFGRSAPIIKSVASEGSSVVWYSTYIPFLALLHFS